LTGFFVTVILFYPLAIDSSGSWFWVGLVVAALVTIGGGALAVNWAGAVHPVRCAVLGGLSGGLAGMIFFCLLGASLAGVGGTVASIVNLTQEIFLISFLAGIGLGALGGWLVHPRRKDQAEVFVKSEPQMAMNAAITALPASLVAMALTAAVFLHLSVSVGQALDMPLYVSLLLVLISHLALTLIIPHEAQQAEHRCCMDEVKMAGFVGIAAAPVLAILLLVTDLKSFSNPLVIVALSASVIMSLKSLYDFFKIILPRRDSFPIPQSNSQRLEAKWFGSIADSDGPRLIVLCIGCGLLMFLPMYITVFSVLINLSQSTETVEKIFIMQALTSIGLAVTPMLGLIIIYLFYFNLGRWFKRIRLKHSN
jgi:hypothetical protein